MTGCSQLVWLCKCFWSSNISNNDRKEKVTFFASSQQIKGKSTNPGHPIWLTIILMITIKSLRVKYFQICSSFGSIEYKMNYRIIVNFETLLPKLLFSVRFLFHADNFLTTVRVTTTDCGSAINKYWHENQYLVYFFNLALVSSK